MTRRESFASFGIYRIVTRTGISHGLKKCPPAGFLPYCIVYLHTYMTRRESFAFCLTAKYRCRRRPAGGDPQSTGLGNLIFDSLGSIKKHPHRMVWVFSLAYFRIVSTSLRDASPIRRNLPRTKKPATGRFFTSLRSAVLFDSVGIDKKKIPHLSVWDFFLVTRTGIEPMLPP